MKFLKNIFNFTYTLLISSAISFAGIYLLLFFTTYSHPKLFILRSGSMSPKFPLGSAVLIGQRQEPEIISPLGNPLYHIGDVITYKSGKETVTHRIAGIKQENDKYNYQVKGDANNSSDTNWILEADVLGCVVFGIPEIGKYVVFAKSSTGNIILVIIPVTILVYSEIMAIKSEIGKMMKKRNYNTA